MFKFDLNGIFSLFLGYGLVCHGVLVSHAVRSGACFGHPNISILDLDLAKINKAPLCKDLKVTSNTNLAQRREHQTRT